MFKRSLIAAVIAVSLATSSFSAELDDPLGTKAFSRALNVKPIPETASGNPAFLAGCDTDVVKKELKGTVTELLFRPYRQNYINVKAGLSSKKSTAADVKAAKGLADYAWKFIEASDFKIMHMTGYIGGTGPAGNITICSAVVTINGKPVSISGNEKRNRIRFGVFNKVTLLIIDYDVNVFNPHDWPNPVKRTRA